MQLDAILRYASVAFARSVLPLILLTLTILQAHAQRMPDLVVTRITSNTNQVGVPVTFSATVKNQGTAALPSNAWIGVLFSVDGTSVCWAARAGGGLQPNASMLLTANNGPTGSFTWMSTAGPHQILADVDDVNRIPESIEDNNQATVVWPILPPKPDLIVTDIAWNTDEAGVPVTFSAMVKNQGNAPIPSTAWIGVLFSVDDVGVSWAARAGGGLQPNTSMLLTANNGPTGVSTWLSTAGLHQILADVDDVNRIPESVEDNNKTTITIEIGRPKQDLIVTDIAWDTDQSGMPVTFSATVKNQGTAAIESDALIGVLFSVDGAGVSWAEQESHALQPNESMILTANRGPADAYTWMATAGSHQVTAEVDDVNRIRESDEANNEFTKPFVVEDSTLRVMGLWSQVYNLVPPAYDIDDDHRSSFIPIHMALLPNGKVLSWGRDPVRLDGGAATAACEPSLSFIWDPSNPAAPVQVFDPAMGSSSLVDCLFCAGHCFLPDGRLLVAGGHIADTVGLNATNIFNFRTNQWSKSPKKMIAGRWYPTTITLSDGTIFVGGGSDERRNSVKTPELWQTNQANPTWTTLPDINKDMGYYPWLSVAPNGKLFWAGPGSVTGYIDPTGRGAWPAQGWTTTTKLGKIRNQGTSVQYGDGKILIAGGYPHGDIAMVDATATVEVIDLNQPTPTWRNVAPLSFPRAYLNSTTLPDGTVLITGGTSKRNNDPIGSIYAAELWDPQTETFTTLATARVPRIYHSSALLLPDGSVAVAGGGMWPYRPIVMNPPYGIEGAHPDLEIFYPPYFFKGARPSITSAPGVVQYGETLFVETPDSANIQQVTLVRLSSVTHSFNENQRFNRLSFSIAEGGLTVVFPSDSKLCPPGDYMLFIVNAAGVPSIATMLNIGPAPVVVP